MKYELIRANSQDTKKIIDYKLASILTYAHDITLEEKNRIKEYVKNNVPKQLESYHLISVQGHIAGCLLVTPHEDGVLLDEIYLDESYRHRGIGTSILENLQARNAIIYLYVYKENTSAYTLYKRMNFEVIEETKSRFYMRYIQEN